MSKADLRLLFKGNVGILVISWLLFGIGYAISRPYLSIYVKMLGGSDFHIGLLNSLGSLSSAILLVPGGYLVDHVGRRRIIVTFTWIISLLNILYALSIDWKMLSIVHCATSALHFYTPALTTILMDSLPSEMRAGGALFTSIIPSIPWFILPFVGGLLIDSYGIMGMRIAYAISGITSLLAAFLRHHFLTETLTKDKRTFQESIRKLLIKSYVDIFSFLNNIPINVIIVLILPMLISSPSAVVFINYRVVYAKEYVNVTMSEWGLYDSTATIFSSLLGFLLLPFLDKIPRNVSAFVGDVLVIVSYLLFLYFGKYGVALSLMLFYTSDNFYFPAISAWIADSVRREYRGRINALYELSGYIGWSWGSLVLGYVYSLNPVLSLVLSTVLVLIDSIVVLVIVRKPKIVEK